VVRSRWSFHRPTGERESHGAIRDAKREAGLLGPEKSFVQYIKISSGRRLTKARGKLPRAGWSSSSIKNIKGGIIKRGDIFRVTGVDEKATCGWVGGQGPGTNLPLKQAKEF